jgi:hypothetical protein
MSFKSWSSAQSAAGKDKPDSKPKPVPSTGAAGAQPAETPAKVSPTANAQPDDQIAKGSPTKKS